MNWNRLTGFESDSGVSISDTAVEKLKPMVLGIEQQVGPAAHAAQGLNPHPGRTQPKQPKSPGCPGALSVVSCVGLRD